MRAPGAFWDRNKRGKGEGGTQNLTSCPNTPMTLRRGGGFVPLFDKLLESFLYIQLSFDLIIYLDMCFYLHHAQYVVGRPFFCKHSIFASVFLQCVKMNKDMRTEELLGLVNPDSRENQQSFQTKETYPVGN